MNYYQRSAKKLNTVTKILILSFFILAVGYLVQKFFQYWNFQSPVLIQLRLPIKRVDLYQNSRSEPLPTIIPRKDKPSGDVILPSPTPTPIKKTTIPSFPKYLTDQGAINRMNILTMARQEYQGDDLIAFDNIIKKESGYRPDAINEIGAGGIGQAYPASKMNCPLDQSGLECQYQWVKSYIKNRYGSPVKAWNFHQKENWY